MSSPLVTVLINTYNYGHFIDQAIDSVLSQNFPMEQVEVLVVDDGSTDDTAERVRKYGSRIRYLYKENGGQASAFNVGLREARGDFVAFLDADDYWLPEKLTCVVRELQRHPDVGMVSHAYLELQESTGSTTIAKIPLVSGRVPDDAKKLLDYRIYATSTLVFRREALASLLPVPESIRVCADAYLALLIIFVAPILALPDPLSVYRLHGKNLFSGDYDRRPLARMKNRVSMLRIALGEVEKWLASHGYTLSRPDIRNFLGQWYLFLENERFAIQPPNRFQYFSSLVRYNNVHRSHQTWKLTALNYLNAIRALASGYPVQR